VKKIPFCAFFLVVVMLVTPQQSVAAVSFFDNGKAKVELPNSLSISTEPDGSLIAMFGKSGDHKLEITHNVVPGAAADSDAGFKFVKDQAIKKGLKAKELNGKTVLMQTGGEIKKEGVTYRIVHWQIGVGRSVFVVTITAPMPMSSDLNNFLGIPLNDLIQSISASGP